MNSQERGFLLLSSHMGDPERKILSPPQLRVLAQRISAVEMPPEDRMLERRDLMALGYGEDMAGRILALLDDEARLDHYLSRGERLDCVPVTRVSTGYPLELRKRLGLDSPGCLWAKGALSLLDSPKIALVGSREPMPENLVFAEEVGRQAAYQGFTLVSGNARGADRAAQSACLRAGGKVISVVADSLADKRIRENVLYLSEDCYDGAFSAQRALSRNRVIHALGAMTFVAQCSYQTGGTWNGTVKNLRFRWSDVYCFADGSRAMAELEQMGARTVGMDELSDFCALYTGEANFLDIP